LLVVAIAQTFLESGGVEAQATQQVVAGQETVIVGVGRVGSDQIQGIEWSGLLDLHIFAHSVCDGRYQAW
jgi:hypothetical protein